ncbi:hypothetical protein LTR94_033092, partial [Friedmanniomyces endolithicus]
GDYPGDAGAASGGKPDGRHFGAERPRAPDARVAGVDDGDPCAADEDRVQPRPAHHPRVGRRNRQARAAGDRGRDDRGRQDRGRTHRRAADPSDPQRRRPRAGNDRRTRRRGQAVRGRRAAVGRAPVRPDRHHRRRRRARHRYRTADREAGGHGTAGR